MKKLFSLVFISTFAMFILSACGEKTPQPFSDAARSNITFSFSDQDKAKDKIQGDVKLVPKQPKLEGVTHFVLRWAGQRSATTGGLISETAVPEGQENEVLHTFPAGSAKVDKYIILFLKHAKGEVNSGLVLEVQDLVEEQQPEPEPEPQPEPQPEPEPEPEVQPEPQPEPETEPTDTTAQVVPLPTVNNVLFEFDKYYVNDEFKTYLTETLESVETKENVLIELHGHCDERGSEEYNLHLGTRRSLAVKRFLLTLGFFEDKIVTKSFGESKPVDPEHNEEAWAKNRRVEFYLSKQEAE